MEQPTDHNELQDPGPFRGRERFVFAGIVALAAAARILYLLRRELPVHDPWRHLQLIHNLREGLGFTLFDGQPFLWYSPLWYRLCALLPASVGPEWLAGLFSVLAVPVLYLYVRREAGPHAAAAAGLLLALCGPVVNFTCHFGTEAPALFLTLAALLLLASRPGNIAALFAGLAFGVALVLRMNFAFNIFLFLPALGRPLRALPLLAGTALPLLLTWLRNHRIIDSYAWVFTWDGLATRSEDFNLLSTLVIQMHPAVQEGLRRLHEIIVPDPQWVKGPDGIHWGLIVFVLTGVACVIAARRVGLLLAVGFTLAYFLLLDTTHSSHFFRIYIVLFPAFFIAAGHLARYFDGKKDFRWRIVGWLPVLLMLVGGAGMLVPPPMVPLELVTPPEGTLTEEAYMVNSTFYHPECLIYRYPDKRFIGMPLDAAHFEEFRREYPEYRSIVWHDISVQTELSDHLQQHPDYMVTKRVRNAYGRAYVVLDQRGQVSHSNIETE